MAKARVFLKRRKAVRNIRKITRTMQLIATARFQKTFQRAMRTKPYTRKIVQLLADLSGITGDIRHPLLRKPDPAKSKGEHVLLILTSNRGLCGGYNAGVLRVAHARYKELHAQNLPVQLEVSGKKGVAYLKFLRIPMAHSFTHLSETVKFAEVAELAQRYIAEFSSGKIDSLSVAYVRFLSTSSQKPVVVQLLPLEPVVEEPASKDKAAVHPPSAGMTANYEFIPEASALLSELLPQAIKAQLFQCFMDATVSEQVARMTAMKVATDSAEEMIRILTQKYNRARQTQITTELMEIIGGAEAMA